MTRSTRAKSDTVVEFIGLTKADLIAIYDPELAIVEAIKMAREMSRAELIEKIQTSRWLEKQFREKPCPKGHAFGDPKCGLMCFIKVIEPMNSPLTSIYTPRASNYKFHSWYTDDLVSARSLDPNYSSVLGDNYRALTAQFDVAVDHTVGWWWRIPYGWYLTLKRKWNRLFIIDGD